MLIEIGVIECCRCRFHSLALEPGDLFLKALFALIRQLSVKFVRSLIYARGRLSGEIIGEKLFEMRVPFWVCSCSIRGSRLNRILWLWLATKEKTVNNISAKMARQLPVLFMVVLTQVDLRLG